MNRTVKIVLISVIGLFFAISLIMGVFYYASYKSEANEIADIINKGNAFMENGLYSDAISSYEKALEKEEGNEQIISAIVKAYMLKAQEEGQSDEALSDYNTAISYISNNKTAYWAIADIYEARGEEDTMMDVLRQGYNDTGDDSMENKVIGIEEERARIQAELEAELAAEQERIAQENARAEMLEPLVELFQNKDFDALKEILREEGYISFSDEVIGDTSYYLGEYDENNNRSGIGLAVYENGYYYYGEYKDGVRSGEGTYMRASYAESSSIGSFFYEGSWADDAPNGQGTTTSNYYKDRIGANDFYSKIISGNFTNGLEDGDMTLEGKTKNGATRKFSYKATNGVAEQSSNEDSGVKGQYIIATSGDDNLTSDDSIRGVEGFVEEE